MKIFRMVIFPLLNIVKLKLYSIVFFCLYIKFDFIWKRNKVDGRPKLRLISCSNELLMYWEMCIEFQESFGVGSFFKDVLKKKKIMWGCGDNQ